MATILSLLPTSQNELFAYQICSMAIFAVIAAILSATRGKFDIYPVMRAVGSGAAFVPSVLLIFYPIAASLRPLFAQQFLAMQLAVGGMIATILTIYGLFKK